MQVKTTSNVSLKMLSLGLYDIYLNFKVKTSLDYTVSKLVLGAKHVKLKYVCFAKAEMDIER